MREVTAAVVSVQRRDCVSVSGTTQFHADDDMWFWLQVHVDSRLFTHETARSLHWYRHHQSFHRGTPSSLSHLTTCRPVPLVRASTV